MSVDVLTAAEDGAARLDDESLLTRATQLNRILFSQDSDLLVLANRWLATGRRFAGLVYCRQGALSLGDMIRDLEMIAQALGPDEAENRIYFLPL